MVKVGRYLGTLLPVEVWLNFLVLGSGDSISTNQRFVIIAMTSAPTLPAATLSNILVTSKPVGIRTPLSPSLAFIQR